MHGGEGMIIYRIIPTSCAQLQYDIISHNRVSIDTELSNITSLRAFLCSYIAVSEKFTVQVVCRNVQIQAIFQVTPKQEDIH